jgi:hypothetical protein
MKGVVEICWDVTLYRWMSGFQSFEGTYFLNFQGSSGPAGIYCLTGEDEEGTMILVILGNHKTKDTASHP